MGERWRALTRAHAWGGTPGACCGWPNNLLSSEVAHSYRWGAIAHALCVVHSVVCCCVQRYANAQRSYVVCVSAKACELGRVAGLSCDSCGIPCCAAPRPLRRSACDDALHALHALHAGVSFNPLRSDLSTTQWRTDPVEVRSSSDLQGPIQWRSD